MLKYYLASVVIIVLLAATTKAQAPEDVTADADLETARQVKDYYADWLSSIPGVSGVRVAQSDRGVPQIVVDARQMTPQLKQIPEKLNGIPVVVAPLPQAAAGLLPSSEAARTRGYLPSPTPEVEISPAPTPQGNKLWPVWPRNPAYP